MSITFNCEHCRREVKAPDEAGGKRGKCPYCDQTNYIPSNLGEADVIPLAEIDEQEEQKRKEEIQALLAQERGILHETGGAPGVPLEHKEDLNSQDLHHFVVNYCLDMADGNLERAQAHAEQLRKFGGTAFEAVEEFLAGKVTEQAISHVPPATLERFLTQLGDQLK